VVGTSSVGEATTGRVMAVFDAGDALWFVVVDGDGRLHYVECVTATIVQWPEDETFE
jgi:hypothetical protein